MDKEPKRKGEKSKEHGAVDSWLRNVPHNIKRFFGLTDEVNLLLWKNCFLKRVEVGLVGLNIRHAFTCTRYIFPPDEMIQTTIKMPNEAEGKKSPQFPGINKLRGLFGKREDQDKSDPLYGFSYGSDAYKFYRRLIAAEMEVNKRKAGEYGYPISRTSVTKFSDGGKGLGEELSPEMQEQFNIAAAQRRKPFAVRFPIFTISITILQFLMTIILSTFGGIAPIGLHPVVEFLLDVDTFSGHQPIEYFHTPNMWIGPSKRVLINYGAMYTPCMRKDTGIIHNLMKQGFSVSDPLGCCFNPLRKIAGTTTEKECNYLSDEGADWNGRRCEVTLKSQVKHLLKPCCYGLQGKCFLTDQIECQFLHGTWFPHQDHCMEVNCFRTFCGSFGITYNTKGSAFIPTGISQSWRFLLPTIYHAGFIHFFMVSIFQWLIGRPLEEMIGWVRLCIIYFISSFGGNLMAGFFDPYTPHVGACGSIAGILAVHFLEIIEGFKVIKWIAREIFGLFLIFVVLLISGTFPLVDNFAHVGGFIFGFLIGIIVMPHICFGKYTVARRQQLVVVCSVLLTLAAFGLLVAFHIIQDSGFCTFCHKFSCISYTKFMCNHTLDLDGTTYLP